MRLILLFIFLHLQPITAAAAAAAAAQGPVNSTISPHCQAECGIVSIPYPFGIGPGCFRGGSRDGLRTGFEIHCKSSLPYTGNIPVINISLRSGTARVSLPINFACFNSSGTYLPKNSVGWYTNLIGSPYRLSNSQNKFTAVGCDTLALIEGLDRKSYTSGCVSICRNETSVGEEGDCSGMGCCQTSIPKGLQFYHPFFQLSYNHLSVHSFNPCSFSFLADQDWFKFQPSDVHELNVYKRNNGRAPVVLDWAIGSLTCDEAKRNLTNYACVSDHSECFDSIKGPGYICNCSAGYQGNPYLQSGCQDVNECDFPDKHPCYGTCSNYPGNYSCSCPPGMQGNPQIEGGCRRNPTKFPLWLKLVIGAIGCILLVVTIGLWINLVLERRKLIRAKQKFFERNGGPLLREQIGPYSKFMIFSKEQLEMATNKFDTDNILGRGGQGTVYKGILEDKTVVAIKKARGVQDQKDFAMEMLFLSQIDHINIVKLLGCCLEVEIPMLVYEYISNGTLFSYIHEKRAIWSDPLDTRLRIAEETTDALDYLHSSASPSVVHGDVKSMNILLDAECRAKVSDFGSSKFVPKDEEEFATKLMVQGTKGYLDPEYLQTRRLTDKSDVYSFGVVLLELLTGRKAIDFQKSDDEGSLTSIFFLALKQNRFLEILDSQVKIEGSAELFHEIAELLRRCLSAYGEDRPAMKEVVEEIRRCRKFEQHPCAQYTPDHEEIERMPCESSNPNAVDPTKYYTSEGGTLPNIIVGK